MEDVKIVFQCETRVHEAADDDLGDWTSTENQKDDQDGKGEGEASHVGVAGQDSIQEPCSFWKDHLHLLPSGPFRVVDRLDPLDGVHPCL
jgi:hypothetical protein